MGGDDCCATSGLGRHPTRVGGAGCNPREPEDADVEDPRALQAGDEIEGCPDKARVEEGLRKFDHGLRQHESENHRQGRKSVRMAGERRHFVAQSSIPPPEPHLSPKKWLAEAHPAVSRTFERK